MLTVIGIMTIRKTYELIVPTVTHLKPSDVRIILIDTTVPWKQLSKNFLAFKQENKNGTAQMD
jgi:hypothetical protein